MRLRFSRPRRTQDPLVRDGQVELIIQAGVAAVRADLFESPDSQEVRARFDAVLTDSTLEEVVEANRVLNARLGVLE